MALILDDCVVETSTTTGTGDFTLGGALVGFKAFSSVCAVGDKCYYLIEAINASGNRTGEWESGYGTYSAANTLTRTTTQKSSNANAAVSFSAGTKRVMVALTSGAVAYRGCLAYKAADLTAQNFTAATAVTWGSESYDTHAFHDVATNTERMTIPAGVCTRVRLSASLTLANLLASNWVQLTIYKNNVAAWTGAGVMTSDAGATTVTCNVQSAVITVVAADYFDLRVQVQSDTSVDITAATSWFQIEVIE